MGLTAAQYNELNERTVTCDSGLEVRIAVVDPASVLARYRLVPESVTLYNRYKAEGLDPETDPKAKKEVEAALQADQYDMVSAFICASALEPRFSHTPTDDPNLIYVSRLRAKDREQLSDAVLALLGLSAEEARTIAPFCDAGDASTASAEMG